jgi:hypothetical protein
VRPGVAAQRGGRSIRVEAPGDRSGGRAAAEVDTHVWVGFHVAEPLCAATETCDHDVAGWAGTIDGLQHDVAPQPRGPSDVFDHEQPGSEDDAKPCPVEPDRRSNEPPTMKHGGADASSQTRGLGAHGSDGSSADRRREGCGGQHMRAGGVEELSSHRIEARVVLGCDAVLVHPRVELRSAAIENAASWKQLPSWWCQERGSRLAIVYRAGVPISPVGLAQRVSALLSASDVALHHDDADPDLANQR